MTASSSSRRRATNVTLPEALVEAAKALEVNLSQACERGVAAAVAEAKAKRWEDENREAIASSNAYVEKHGLPFARFRRF
jgi:antitoxin CcdA